MLYGTDSPLYFTPLQRSYIDHAETGMKIKAEFREGKNEF